MVDESYTYIGGEYAAGLAFHVPPVSANCHASRLFFLGRPSCVADIRISLATGANWLLEPSFPTTSSSIESNV